MTKPSAVQNPKSASSEPGLSRWPDGWYVYESGQLSGPLSATDAFNRPAETHDGKPRLVSRKGFTQWYALRDLSEIFQISATMEKAADGIVVTPPPPLVARSPRPQVTAKQIDVRATPRAVAVPPPSVIQGSNNGVGMTRHVIPSRPKTMTPPPPVPSSAVAAATGASAGATVMRSEAAATTERTRTLAKTTLAPASRAAPLPVDKTLARKAVVHEYFVARGRLRLGKLRNPWASGLFSLPMSLGLYLPVWYAATEREIVQHTQGASFTPRWGKTCAALALVPGLHLAMTFRLAEQIRAMEQQNKYRNVSPWVALLLALVPPFALVYLQQALNRHWLLHAKHLVIKRRSEAGARSAGQG